MVWPVTEAPPTSGSWSDALHRRLGSLVPTYRLHDTTGEGLGLMEHAAPNVDPGDVVMLPDGREALEARGRRVESGTPGGAPSTNSTKPGRPAGLRRVCDGRRLAQRRHLPVAAAGRSRGFLLFRRELLRRAPA